MPVVRVLNKIKGGSVRSDVKYCKIMYGDELEEYVHMVIPLLKNGTAPDLQYT